MLKNTNKGFTLIELIMVMIILGIMAAVAIPRYLETIEKSEVAAEDAVVNNIMVALENYAQNKMLTEGRRYWPDNPFDVLSENPAGYSGTDNGTEQVGPLDGVADSDGEWTFDYGSSRITHQRADNSRYYWAYDKGTQDGDNATIGSLGNRQDLE